jgi:DNA-binding transcriptional ArsR family regulator
MENICKISNFFEALSDEKRVKILLFLIEEGEKNVSQIHKKIGMTMPAISYQLKILYLNNIIDFEKIGKEKYYKISDEHVSCIVKDTINHVKCSNERFNLK